MAILISEIITAAKGRADMVESNFVTPADWLEYARASYKRLYNILVQSFQEYFTVASTDYTIDSVGKVALPADFQRMGAVDLKDGSDYGDCYPSGSDQRNSSFRGRFGIFWRENQWSITHRIIARNVYFYPTDISPGRITRFWYTPSPTVVDTTTAIPVDMEQWADFLILDCARMARVKEETDPSEFKEELAQIRRDIEEQSLNRNMQETGVVRDVNGGMW